MAIKYLSAKSDIIFKMIFGNSKNIGILTAFLKSVLSIPEEEYKELTIVDPHLKRDSEEDKLGILDVKILTKSDNIIDVEIQVLDVPKMRERIVFYTSKMITEQISSGEKYDKIKKVISIIITDYKLISENDVYHNVYRLHDKRTGSEFTDIIEINTLKLPELPHETDNSLLWDWLKFLKSSKEEEMEMLSEKNPDVKKAVCVLAQLSQDDQTRLLFESREKARRDWEMRIDNAFAKGEIKGKIEGKIEALITLVSKYGIDLESAMKDTGLDKKYKEQVICELKKKKIDYK